MTDVLGDSAIVFRRYQIDEFAAVSFQRRKRPCLIGFHEPRVANHVGSQNCRKASFFAFLGHRSSSFTTHASTDPKYNDRWSLRESPANVWVGSTIEIRKESVVVVLWVCGVTRDSELSTYP